MVGVIDGRLNILQNVKTKGRQRINAAKYVREGMMANEADETPEEIVEHLAELGLNPEDNDLSDMLDDALSTPRNMYVDHPGCKITVHKPKPR